MGLYLAAERKRFSGLTRPPTAGPEQVAYDKEEKVLKLEENLLYQLVHRDVAKRKKWRGGGGVQEKFFQKFRVY